jgi:hypothetical protein
LKGLLFLFAKMRPGEGGGAVPNAAPPSLSGALTTLILLGNWLDVGVAGRTFTEECGDLETLWACDDTETAGEAREAEEVEEAFECVWWWCGILLILDTELDVLFLPLKPPEDLR